MRAPLAVPAERSEDYRRDGLWDGRTLRAGIEAAAARRPGAIALADNERRLTYGQLARSVAAAVAALASHGLRAGDAAVLVAGNTVAAVVAYHALLRAGVAAVLLDRRCGPADVRVALEAVGPAPVIVPAAERTRLVGNLDADALLVEELERGAPPGRWPEPDRDVAAVVLFTSGTTGRPKGVVHSLNTVTAGAANLARITGAGDETVAFLVSPVMSITGVMQMHLAADRHAALVLEDRFDPEASLDRLNAAGATFLGGAPVIAEHILQAAAGRPDRPGRAVSLRTLALGGAMLPRPLLEVATDAFGIEIVRVYGSSEAPNFTGSLPADGRDRRLADDGALMPGGEIRVGSADHPQEGMLRGPGVFLGYLDPADNAAGLEGDWYRTGDLVEVHDGRLTVVGRLKEIVNRNGLKIALAEVDGALAGLPGVVEHACFGVPDAATGERLAVAVRPETGAVVTLDGVVAHLLAQGLARRKLPEQLVLWDEPLPRTASGKVVRTRLAMEAPAKRSYMRR